MIRLSPSALERHVDLIGWEEASTLPGLFNARVARSGDAIAYRSWSGGAWRVVTWDAMAKRVGRMRAALRSTGLATGDRVGLLLPNSPDWVAFDVAAMAEGLVTVPLYAHDSTANIDWILDHAGARLCLVDTEARWAALAPAFKREPPSAWIADGRDNGAGVRRLAEVVDGAGEVADGVRAAPGDLATLVYTSGTTGRPKGVMLSHRAILRNAAAVAAVNAPRADDVFLSLLPLAHAFERTMGCHLAMMGGSTTAFARSAETLREDLRTVRPSVLLAVPHLYERLIADVRAQAATSPVRRVLLDRTTALGWRLHEARAQRGALPSILARFLFAVALEPLVVRQVRLAFGGRLRVAVSGGAPLPPEVARALMGLGVPVVEGYGLTEAAPVVTGTTVADALPGTVGRPLPGIDVQLDEAGELLVRSPSLMEGYWRDADATAAAITVDGWLRTGDLAEIVDGRVVITGRRKEIIVLSTGEKVLPSDVETTIQREPLVEQACVVGDGRPCLVALVVLDATAWRQLADASAMPADALGSEAAKAAVLEAIARTTRHLPEHRTVRAVHLLAVPWTVADGTLTPTLKIKRHVIEQRHARAIDALYADLERRRCEPELAADA